jgi:predicted nuclease of predicted toxin-antitoxin system
VRFLVDAQLPVALADFLRTQGHECHHVLEIGLAQASDLHICEYARQNRAIIVTKDEDFLEWTGQPDVAVLWIRLGNCANPVLLQSIVGFLPIVISRFERGEKLVEIR